MLPENGCPIVAAGAAAFGAAAETAAGTSRSWRWATDCSDGLEKVSTHEHGATDRPHAKVAWLLNMMLQLNSLEANLQRISTRPTSRKTNRSGEIEKKNRKRGMGCYGE